MCPLRTFYTPAISHLSHTQLQNIHDTIPLHCIWKLYRSDVNSPSKTAITQQSTTMASGDAPLTLQYSLNSRSTIICKNVLTLDSIDNYIALPAPKTEPEQILTNLSTKLTRSCIRNPLQPCIVSSFRSFMQQSCLHNITSPADTLLALWTACATHWCTARSCSTQTLLLNFL